MIELRQVAVTIGLAMAMTVPTCGTVHGQEPEASLEPHLRSLASFESVYLPDIVGQGPDPTRSAQISRLTRELRERLVLQGQSRATGPYPLAFYWTLVDSISRTSAGTVIATAQPDPLQPSGIVIVFADTDGNAIAAVHSSTISTAMGVLNDLSHRTTVSPGRASGAARASRPIGTYPTMYLSYRSPAGGSDEFNLLPRLMSALRRRGPWTLVDSMHAEGDARRAETVQCFMWHVRGSLPTLVSLRCLRPLLGTPDDALLPFDVRRAEHVLFMMSGSCKGCLSTDFVVTSTKARADAAVDNLARRLLEHVDLERKIYSVQRGDRPLGTVR